MSKEIITIDGVEYTVVKKVKPKAKNRRKKKTAAKQEQPIKPISTFEVLCLLFAAFLIVVAAMST